jgi:hypothetical protein
VKVRGAPGADRHSPADQKIAQTMFRSIKTLISTLVEHERQVPAVSRLQLVTAALLTRVATVHDEMSQARRAKNFTSFLAPKYQTSLVETGTAEEGL